MTRKPHFYKAYSRLGLFNVPINSTQKNIGVENGPNAILSSSFLKTFRDMKVTDYSFPLPESIKPGNYFKTITEHSRLFADVITDSSLRSETQVVAGGDHSVALGSVLSLFDRANPKDIGYIQFDSHGDIHSSKTSPSGNFHGMFVRALVDRFDDPFINSVMTKKLPMSNLLYIGNLELEDEEKKFMEKNVMATITGKNLQTNYSKVIDKLIKFMSGFSQIHVSIDIDVFDRSIVRATGTPSVSGLSKEDVFPLLSLLAKHPRISFDAVEVNPLKPEASSTIKITQDVVTTLLSNNSSS